MNSGTGGRMRQNSAPSSRSSNGSDTIARPATADIPRLIWRFHSITNFVYSAVKSNSTDLTAM
jgi:hypothetical protein